MITYHKEFGEEIILNEDWYLSTDKKSKFKTINLVSFDFFYECMPLSNGEVLTFIPNGLMQ